MNGKYLQAMFSKKNDFEEMELLYKYIYKIFRIAPKNSNQLCLMTIFVLFLFHVLCVYICVFGEGCLTHF